jgi:hypothetical protein
MNTNDDYYQPMWFSKMEATKTEYQKYQIKSFDDPQFGITLNVKEDEDPEFLALESLGYFVVPETTIN